jgi:protein gp37
MKDSLIEWTHHTFNPWIGCTKVSPGCANCYAETLMDTRWQRVNWGKGNERQRTSESNWAQLRFLANGEQIYSI